MATPLTWVFSMAATVNEEWIEYTDNVQGFGGFSWFCTHRDHKELLSYYDVNAGDKMCATCESSSAGCLLVEISLPFASSL